MKTLRGNKIISIRGFNFHLPAGYPEPSAEILMKAWNTGANGQMDNFRHLDSVARNYGQEVEMEYDWKEGRWAVKGFFKTAKP